MSRVKVSVSEEADRRAPEATLCDVEVSSFLALFLAPVLHKEFFGAKSDKLLGGKEWVISTEKWR